MGNWEYNFFLLSKSFQIANPNLGETVAQNALVNAGVGNGIGDCVEDTFSVSTSAGPGSPVICGTNTGYHSKFLIFVANRAKKFAIAYPLLKVKTLDTF